MHIEFGGEGENGVSVRGDYFSAFSARDVSRRPTSAIARAFRAKSGVSIVDLARAMVVAQISRILDAETLAASLLVSESTLRRAVLAETGLRLSAFVLNIRLERAHAWLSSDAELRSQRQITDALGLRSAQAFARAYRKKFGESMVDTRRRAIK